MSAVCYGCRVILTSKLFSFWRRAPYIKLWSYQLSEVKMKIAEYEPDKVGDGSLDLPFPLLSIEFSQQS
jgi:hypothetical protein